MTEFRPSRFEILPVVIKNLVIINALVFLAQNTVGRYWDMDNLLGLHHVKSSLFQPWQLVTHLFLHGSIGHLFANMFALWMFGSVLENIWGPKKFLTFFIICGLGAAIIQLISLWFQYADIVSAYVSLKNHPTPGSVSAFFQALGLSEMPEGRAILSNYITNPDSSSATNQVVSYASLITDRIISNPTIGASGAVFGILAAFVYLFPNTDIYLYFLFPIKAKYIGLAYFGYEVFSAIQNDPGSNIAHWAHVGGGLVGFLLVLTWNKTNRRQFY